jgi:hypothetical protein
MNCRRWKKITKDLHEGFRVEESRDLELLRFHSWELQDQDQNLQKTWESQKRTTNATRAVSVGRNPGRSTCTPTQCSCFCSPLKEYHSGENHSQTLL